MGPTYPRRVHVFHVGVAGDVPGGMAQVLAGYVSWNYVNCIVRSIRSTRGKRDPLGPILWLGAAVKLILARVRHGRSVAIFHVSQGGAFVREGSLAWFARLLGMSVGIHIHGSSFPAFAERHPRLVRASLRAAGTVFTLTDATSGWVAQNVYPAPRIVKVPNAVAVPRTWPIKEAVILFAGEVGHRKGVDVLLEAWRDFDASSEWKLLIAGPLSMDVSDYQDFSNVDFCGSLPHAEVVALQSIASIAVLPSRDEALPMFLLEAMAQRCAVVGTDVGSVAELLDGAGLVVDSGSIEQLQSAIRKLTDDALLREDIAARAATKIEQCYSAELCAAELEREWVQMSPEMRKRGAA